MRTGVRLLFVLLALGCGVAAQQDRVYLESGRGQRPFDVTNHSVPVEELRGGGPPRDGIPAIDHPKFVAAGEARFLRGDDRVLGVDHNGVAKAYPIRILNWHEIVNDDFAGQPVAVTWCPLCVSGIVYDPRVNGRVLTFGISGKLYKSALVMYDRQTESLWSQILQQAITGPLTGTKLAMIPAQHTTWEDWRKHHPQTLVLSPDTGHERDYGRNPYQRYWEGNEPSFRSSKDAEAARKRHSLRPMERVLGVEVNGVHKAYPFSVLKKNAPSFQDVLADKAVRVHFDPKSENAWITDAKGAILPSVTTFWFAWTDFYPDSLVFTSDGQTEGRSPAANGQ